METQRTPSPVLCEHCPLRARPVFRALTETELAFMHRFKKGELHR